MKPNRRNKIDTAVKIQIVTDYIAGLPIKEIRSRYKVSHQTIYNVINEPIEQLN